MLILYFFYTFAPKNHGHSIPNSQHKTKMIGIFDSGYGGLTILNEIRKVLPEYNYLYLGDNARAPYGTRSFDVIYEYTLQAVNYLYQQGCNLIILACNTASAKALRTIQQRDIDPNRLRVLGVIRPTAEYVPLITQTGHIGVLATPGTVTSESYVIELQKQNPQLVVTQQACPMWVPLIESGEHMNEGANYFVEKYLTELLTQDPKIDTIILGCTHYPLLQSKVEEFLKIYKNTQLPVQNSKFKIISQGEIVANSLQDYLLRHPDIAERARDNSIPLIQNSKFLTTESATKFAESASLFLAEPIQAQHIEL